MKITKYIFMVIAATFFIFGIALTSAASETTKWTKQQFDYKDFNKIDVSGTWDVDIKYGEKYKIKVSSSEDLQDYIDVDKSGDILYLKTKIRPWAWFRKTTEGDRIKAEITMPYLEQIEASGESTVSFKNLDLGILHIDISGESKIACYDNKIEDLFIDNSGSGSVICKSTIDNLTIEASGSSDLDFASSSILNAKVFLSGSSKAKLKMQGGDLSGHLSGNSSLAYKGNVKTQNILTSGSSTVITTKE